MKPGLGRLDAGPASHWLLAAVVLGAVLRAAPLLVPHAFFPDEIFQYLEPAHRLVFGPAVIPWEYRYGVRSWLLPLSLAGPMWLGGVLAPTSGLYLLLPKLALLALSLPVLWAALAIGRSVGRWQGLFALLVAATWFEWAYFATQALTEAAAVAVALPGIALMIEQRRLALAGGLLGLAAVVRFQYAPALAVLALVELWPALRRGDWRPFLRLAIGALGALLLGAAVDLAGGDLPFAWIARNIRYNIVLGRSHTWTEGPFFYPWALLTSWHIWALPILALSCVGARHRPALLIGAVANVAVHTLIAHKEYRYILLSTALLVLLAAIGTVDAIKWLARDNAAKRQRLTWIAAIGWLAASLSLAVGPARDWWRAGQPMLGIFAQLRNDPDTCGVALDGLDWAGSGGYAYLHRPIPLLIYGPLDTTRMRLEAGSYNRLLAQDNALVPPGFGERSCYDTAPGYRQICVYRRKGSCAPTGAWSPAEINHMLIRRDR